MKKYFSLFFLLLIPIIISANSNEKENKPSDYSTTIITLENGKKIVLTSNFTWYYYEQKIDEKEVVRQYKHTLRQNINATDQEIITACEMRQQGWIYIMPAPKSDEAAWFNFDADAEWYNGWWSNFHTQKYSKTTPILQPNGRYEGDDIDLSNTFSKGKSPSKPDIYMFLLSDCGGPTEKCINLFKQNQ